MTMPTLTQLNVSNYLRTCVRRYSCSAIRLSYRDLLAIPKRIGNVLSRKIVTICQSNQMVIINTVNQRSVSISNRKIFFYISRQPEGFLIRPLQKILKRLKEQVTFDLKLNNIHLLFTHQIIIGFIK